MQKSYSKYIKRIISHIQERLSPSERQLMLNRWREDGGDNTLRFNYDLDEDSLVFDLGGYQGQWASDLFGRYKCHIFIFEPVSSFASQIRERFAKNEKLKVYNYGLGGGTRSEVIRIEADGSSLFGKSGDKQLIKIVDVKNWLENNMGDFKRIDLMKINIEGGEYELLDRIIKTGLIYNIDNIQVQFHQISSNSASHMERIQQDLSKTHEPTYQYKFVWENWKKRIYSDRAI